MKNGFPVRLKALLKEKKLTQAQVAKDISTSVPSVNRWTRGGEIEYENLRSLADYLDVNWVWLRYGEEAINSIKETLVDSSTHTDMRREYLSQIMESEARMKSALALAEIVDWEWNVLTDTLTYSDNAQSVFNQSPDLIREQLLPFSALPLEQLMSLFSASKPYHWDFELKTASDDSERWFTSRGKIVFDSLRRPLKIIAISAEITARKQSELALERSEYMMRKIIDIIPVGLWAADKDGTICLANPEVKRIWGGAKYVDLAHYDQYKGWREKTGEAIAADEWTLAKAIIKGETSSPEVVKIKGFDEQYRTIIMYAEPLLDHNDQIIGAIEINQDITELKQSEHELQLNLQGWDSLISQNSFGVLCFNDIKIITQANDYLHQFCGLDNGSLVNQSVETLFNNDIITLYQQKLAKLNDANASSIKIKAKLNSQLSLIDDVELQFHFIKNQQDPSNTVVLIFNC